MIHGQGEGLSPQLHFKGQGGLNPRAPSPLAPAPMTLSGKDFSETIGLPFYVLNGTKKRADHFNERMNLI